MGHPGILKAMIDSPAWRLIHALNTIGTTELLAGTPGGQEKLERSLELGRRADSADHVGRAFIHLVWAGTRLRNYELADRYLDQGLTYLGDRGLELWRFYLLAFRARIELDRGRWSEAVDSAGLVLQKRCISTFPRILALVVLGLVRARRGEPDAQSPLGDALALATPTQELPRIAPVAAARAEGAWLAGDREGSAQRRRTPSGSRCGKGSRGRSESSPAGAGAPDSTPTPRTGRPSRTRSRSPAAGRVQPSYGRRSAAPTKPPSRLPTRTMMALFDELSPSFGGSAHSRRRRSSPGGCRSAGSARLRPDVVGNRGTGIAVGPGTNVERGGGD